MCLYSFIGSITHTLQLLEPHKHGATLGPLQTVKFLSSFLMSTEHEQLTINKYQNILHRVNVAQHYSDP